MLREIRKRERGANLVEFALLAPLLILLVLGIIEFGWLFSQNNDVRHGAREGARMAAVDSMASGALVTATCASMDLTSPVTVQFTDSASGAAGEIGTVRVEASPNSLSGLGLIEVFLPATLVSEVDFRLEQPSSLWGNVGPTSC